MKIARTPFTDKAWVKSLVKQHEMTFARCAPPIALGQTKRRKIKPSKQPTPVCFKIKESSNASERQIKVKPFKDGCEWEAQDFKLNLTSVAEQVGWDTPEKKQANFAFCLEGTAKEHHLNTQTKRKLTNARGALDGQQLWGSMLNDWTKLEFS